MLTPARRALRYAASWLREPTTVRQRDVTLRRGAREVPATLLLPPPPRAARGRWIVLHGITRPGRAHPQLVRFSRALASTGSAVLVPEVPEWRALDLAPDQTAPTVAAALEALEAVNDAGHGPPGLVGFSFGSPQAVAASGLPEFEGRLAGVVGFGGYFDLERTIRFQFTGRHEWDGRTHVHRPDPYGRWIVGANYLTAIPSFQDHTEVASSLRRLAAEAGDRGIPSWDPAMHPLMDALRSRLRGEGRALFDVFAPPGGGDPAPTEAEELVHALTAAARRATPLIDPGPALGRTPGPVHILHGRADHLIPFTEGLRMARALEPRTEVRVTITRLFGHSAQDPFPILQGPREAVLFLRALAGMLRLA